MNKSSTYLVVNYFPTYRYRTYFFTEWVNQGETGYINSVEVHRTGILWMMVRNSDPLQLVKLPWVRITLALG